jgi:hypothetical protein
VVCQRSAVGFHSADSSPVPGQPDVTALRMTLDQFIIPSTGLAEAGRTQP